jgi:hypothetical protein
LPQQIDRSPQTIISEQTAVYASQRGRDRLAQYVVVGSFLTLFLLVSALIGLAQISIPQVRETATNAFTAILPVLAGWVGTVLALYFSAASHQASLEAISRSGGRPGPSTWVSEKMIPVSSIVGLKRLEEKGPQDISILDLQQAFRGQLPNGAKVTRLLFVERGIFKYIMHFATLNAFIVKNPAGATEKTFADMLADEETLRQISQLVVFVSASTTLGDAKAALDKVSGAQDIIVTGSGNATEPMLGWLSNIDLTKTLQAD